MNTQCITALGLILDFVGAGLLAYYANKTLGATTQADQDHVASPRWPFVGWILLAAGFLAQLFAIVV